MEQVILVQWSVNFFQKKKFQVKSIDNLIYNQKKPLKKKKFYFYNLDITKKKIHDLIDDNSTVILLAGLVGRPNNKKIS